MTTTWTSTLNDSICFPGIHGINLNASKTVLKVGSAIEISCTVIGGLINPYITWFKGIEMIVLSHRRNITTDERQSRLTITNATAKDEGVYHCYTRWTSWLNSYCVVGHLSISFYYYYQWALCNTHFDLGPTDGQWTSLSSLNMSTRFGSLEAKTRR